MLVRQRERLLLGLAFTLGSLHCTPDFDSLRGGAGLGGEGAGAANGGVPGGGMGGGGMGDGGAKSGGAGSAGAGSNSPAGTGGNLAGSPPTTGGTGARPMGGSSSAGEPGAAGAAGAAPSGCQWTPPISTTHYDGFDGGLDGTGFSSATTTCSATSTLGATTSCGWDESTGKTCPGSLKFEAVFKGYADGAQADESAVTDLRFSDANWTGGTKLHAWARVTPTNAPISGVRFFVMSGSSYLYSSILDDKGFAAGNWYELVLPLSAGASYEPKVVHRIGVAIVLRRAGEPNNPLIAPTVDIWLDDVWVE